MEGGAQGKLQRRNKVLGDHQRNGDASAENGARMGSYEPAPVFTEYYSE
jgi:hypothetical protein